MKTPLAYLINAVIIEIEQIDDENPVYSYWHIETDKGYIAAYNPVMYCCANNGNVLFNASIAEDVIKQRIVSVEINDAEHIGFTLSNGKTIKISLADEDYIGSEAYYIHLNAGEMIVD